MDNGESYYALKSGHVNARLFPDGDAFDQWSQLACKAQAQGLDVIVSDLLEAELTATQKAAGWDLADYLLASEETAVVAPQPLGCPCLAAAATNSSAYAAALLAEKCPRCGDPLNRAGECELCQRPLPF
ncbi:MAG: hypothetical protein JST84_11310 [Acidobacteria bacterium]|nr:hypothetical protein [Acidobacteriota bacterium]